MPRTRYLGLRLAGRDVAVDAATVRAIVPGGDRGAVAPGCAWLAGTVRYGGADLLVVDLGVRRRWGRSRGAVIVILEQKARRAALLADGVSGLLEPLRRQPAPGVLRTAGRPRVLVGAEEVLLAAEEAGSVPWSVLTGSCTEPL